MKRVLLLAYFFPPLGGGGCQRTLKLVRYLEPEGWRSTVVTTRDRDYWILDPTLVEEIPASTEVLRVGGLTGGRLLDLLSRRGGLPIQESQGARRPGAFRALRALQRWVFLPDAYSGWSEAARRAAEERIRAGDIDAIWTTSSPESAHLAGLRLKQRHRLPWVADFRDPWVGRVTYKPPTPWHDARHRAMERCVIHAADRVTLVSEAMVSLYRGRYPEVDPSKFVFLPNGFDSEDWRRADHVTAQVERGDSQHFVLLHAGQLAHRPTVRTLLASARGVLERDGKAREDLRVRFVGGNEEIGPRDPDQVALGPVLEMMPSLPHVESLVQMRRADALVLLGHGGSADSLLYTGKLYEYLSSGRPVLAIVDEGPAADLIRSTGAGVVVPALDERGAGNALQHWLDAWRQGKDLSVHLPRETLTSWERRHLAYKASRILAEISPAKPR